MKVLNVGGNNKSITLPPQYAKYEHLLLDIDPTGEPDIVCDARQLKMLAGKQFDAIYCSHNLEHYYRHDVAVVLSGFIHLLNDQGFAQIRVPDIQALMQLVVARKLDIEDVLYQSSAGPVMVLDILYGLHGQIEKSGQDFFAHKTGFTPKSLVKALETAGFHKTYSKLGDLEINVLAFKSEPTTEIRQLFDLHG